MDRKTKPDRKENFEETANLSYKNFEEKDKNNSDLSEEEAYYLHMKIDFLGHSGFFVESESVLLLFDYYYGDLSFLAEKLKEKPLFVFASHAHEDHFNPAIFSLADVHKRTKYLLSFDIKGNPAVPENRDIQYLDAERTYEIEGLGSVETLISTDEGVAFLVKTACETLFYAGDLHWWDWPGEDPEWLNEQETVFKREIKKLAGLPIDVAFAVLDSRLEENYWKGMALILSILRPRYVLPMHFWKDRSVMERFKELPFLRESGTILLDSTKETQWEI